MSDATLVLQQRDQLFETVQAYREANRLDRAQLAQVTAQRDALVAALQRIVAQFDTDADGRIGVAAVNDARAAIALAGGGK